MCLKDYDRETSTPGYRYDLAIIRSEQLAQLLAALALQFPDSAQPDLRYEILTKMARDIHAALKTYGPPPGHYFNPNTKGEAK